jgi:Protein of unknown function (DUF4043)
VTQVNTGSFFAVKKFSVALAALGVRKPTNLSKLMGMAPQQSGAEATLKQQSNPGLPGIMIRDLAQGAGEKVTMEAVDVLGGFPIMGDQMREGKGESMNLASMEIKIDLASKVVKSVGGKMTQKRTVHRLRSLGMAQLMGYFPRLLWQRALVHMAGARGAQADVSWCLPLQSNQDFVSYMINPVLAPTFNRHLVVDSTLGLVQGGQQIPSIDVTDVWKLSTIDLLSEYLDSIEFKVQPVRIPGDPAADDEPIKGVLMLDPQCWTQLLTDATTNNNIRSWQAAALERAKYAGGQNAHPLFRGDIYMWNGILMRKMDHSIYFNPGDSVNIVTAANRLTATETQVTVPALANGRMSRSLLLGAQAFSVALGANDGSDIEAAFKERSYDYNSKYECMGEWMGAEAKNRFKFKNSAGDLEPTDHGVIAVDAAVKAVG